MDQGEFTKIVCARPQNFAWFLGAGASASAGLPTAYDIIWDLKRRHYSAEEGQDIARQDVQIDAVRTRIQDYMVSKGFPEEDSSTEYTTYFEKIFGTDKERQRRYLSAILSEDKVTLTVGNRVLGAFLASGHCRAVFTTNFDSVLEKAVAEVSGRSLSAFHLEGSRSAKRALDNEEFPVYCKLHGDFRHDSIKNLSDDLAAQNEELSDCLINAGNRFGFIVAGYSGRDESVMALFHAVLSTSNPFPHGLFWIGMKGREVSPPVRALLDQAQEIGVNAQHVEIETFDTLMLRLWRNIEDRPPELDRKVRKTDVGTVTIPLGGIGRGSPLVRMNGLPLVALPSQCQVLSFTAPKEWKDLRDATRNTEGSLILTKADSVWCWGSAAIARNEFKDVTGIEALDLSAPLKALDDNLFLKGFLEEALCRALARGKPLLCRTNRNASFLIADRHAEDHAHLAPLSHLVGKPFGAIAGLFTPATDDHPNAEKVAYAEATRVSVDYRDGRYWLLLYPDIWIWPPRARPLARDFLSKRRSDRLNERFNQLLNAWISVVLGTDERNSQVAIAAFADGTDLENPSFTIASRTAFARRSA